MVEEEHVSQYESLNDPTTTWLEKWLMHEYTECYLYYSVMNDETDEYIRQIWKEHFEMEVAHLKRVAELLKKYEKKNYLDVIPEPEFPKLLKFGENKKYIRDVLLTVGLTSVKEEYIDVDELSDGDRFFEHLSTVNQNPCKVASHLVIENFMRKYGKDYRFEEKAHPIKALQNRKKDNVIVGAREGVYKEDCCKR
jgi:hypothetical protein